MSAISSWPPRWSCNITYRNDFYVTRVKNVVLEREENTQLSLIASLYDIGQQKKSVKQVLHMEYQSYGSVYLS